MRIQFNIHKTIAINEKDQFYLRSLISGNLENYDADILEVKVHLSDENKKRTELSSMQCSLETETRGGTRPLSVSCEAENIVLAVLIALNKLTFSLETIFMRLKKPTNNFAITKRIKCLAFIPVIQLYV